MADNAKFDIKGGVEEFTRDINNLTKSMPAAIRKAVIAGTTIIYMESRGAMSAGIYNVPIPSVTRVRGRNKGKSVPAWKRTSTLLRNERFQFYQQGGRAGGIIYNNTPYAYFRHEMKGEREAPWRDIAMQNKAADVVKKFSDIIDVEFTNHNL